MLLLKYCMINNTTLKWMYFQLVLFFTSCKYYYHHSFLIILNNTINYMLNNDLDWQDVAHFMEKHTTKY